MSVEEKFRQVLTALETENAALIKGQYKELPQLAEKKRMSMLELEQVLKTVPPRNTLKKYSKDMNRLKDALIQNARRLSAAMNGAKAAEKRLQLLKDQDRYVGAYSRLGKQIYLGQNQGVKNKLL